MSLSGSDSSQISFTQQGVPTHVELVLPVLRAIHQLGGSARSSEITELILGTYPDAEALLEHHYTGNPEKKVFTDRIAWARSTAKFIEATESPSRGVALLTDLGEQLVAMDEKRAHERIEELFRESQKQQRLTKAAKNSQKTPSHQTEDDADSELLSSTPAQEIVEDAAEDDTAHDADWKSVLLNRLHQLSPEGFEKFVIYLLRNYGLQLQHMGGTGDEGVDAIGTAPLSPVLSSRVAVQIKRYAPEGKPIGREPVALFQRDAQTKGAERAILVTLSRFTDAARKAATMTTPTVDLISGDRLAELIRQDGQSGVKSKPTVDLNWFKKFE